MGIFREINEFTKQALDKYEKVAKKHGIKSFIRDTPLEQITIKNLRDLYLQLKYICEYSDRKNILENPPDKRLDLVNRRGEILIKICYNAFIQFKKRNEIPRSDPIFTWGSYNEKLTVTEYIDITLSEIASLIEYYLSCLKDKVVLNWTLIAKDLEIDFKKNRKEILSQQIFYDELSNITSNQYGIRVNSLQPYPIREVRNSVFHMDYTYEKTPTNFKILLIDYRTKKIDSIMFDKLLHRSQDIIAKINLIKVITTFFSDPKNNLPLKGY